MTMNLKPRGAAAVEMAIMMIVLVPTFMYVLFLQDLLWYKLEMQETVVSTPFDYNFMDWNRFRMAEGNIQQPPPEDNAEEDGTDSPPGYNPADPDETPITYATPPVDNAVARNSRRTYCDHTSAYDGDVQYDCKDQHHHTNYAAHQCWLTGAGGNGPKGLQVTCTREKDSSMARTQGLRSFNADFNAGGIIECHARLGVTNYFLPNKFFSWWGKNDVTKMKRFGGNNAVGSSGNTATHDDAKGVGGDGQAIVFGAQYMSVLHDPWAVNRPEDITPDSGDGPYKNPKSRFRDRMLSYWEGPSALLSNARLWHNQMGRDELLSFPSQMDNVGDHLGTPPLAWKSAHEREFGRYHASGWDDPRQKSAYGARQGSYFAMDGNYF